MSPARNFPRSLVTGGAGFIGSHLAEALLAQGGEVRVLDDLSSGRRENLPPAGGRFEFLEGSISDAKLLAAAMEGVDTVFHLAGLVAVPESVENPRKCIELNDLGVFNTYQAASAAGARRLVFSSRSAGYGEAAVPQHEDLAPRPDTPYALHKLLGEHYGLFFDRHRGLESVYLRYFNVYGPRQLPDSPYSGVISLFMARLKEGRPGLIFDDGQQTRDFVHVDDVVRANLAAAVRPGVSSLAFNIGSGRSVTIGELYGHLAALAGRENAPEFAPPRPGDIRHSSGPIDRAARLLGYAPRVGLREGLGGTWDWFSRQPA
ncbi:MAG: NAD-dependent epimerase/dehydratase family protein [Candidatus Adiutrix sp.]|jgi:UDP-glucose 4-epimerase|nr:NAD-dependent epimerase/dehydratase family protein [Candidatus Adiutrix sp.]